MVYSGEGLQGWVFPGRTLVHLCRAGHSCFRKGRDMRSAFLHLVFVLHVENTILMHMNYTRCSKSFLSSSEPVVQPNRCMEYEPVLSESLNVPQPELDVGVTYLPVCNWSPDHHPAADTRSHTFKTWALICSAAYYKSLTGTFKRAAKIRKSRLRVKFHISGLAPVPWGIQPPSNPFLVDNRGETSSPKAYRCPYAEVPDA